MPVRPTTLVPLQWVQDQSLFGNDSDTASNTKTAVTTTSSAHLSSTRTEVIADTGMLNVTNSEVNLYGNYTMAQLAPLESKGDTVGYSWYLAITGATLNVGPAANFVLARDGTIVGGTIKDAGSGLGFQGGTLEGCRIAARWICPHIRLRSLSPMA